MITHYLKVAWRNLWKHKAQSIISLLGIAVSLLCFSICLYCSRYIFDTNHCFINHNRIVDLNTFSSDDTNKSGITPSDLVSYLRQIQPNGIESVCKVCALEPRPYNVEIANEKMLPYDIKVIETDSAFSTVFTPQIVCGSWIAAAATPNALVLTESTAQRIFKEPSEALGKRFILTQRLDSSPQSTPRTGGIVYTVQAVIADIPQNTTLGFLKTIEALTLNDSEGIVSGEMRQYMQSGYSFALLHREVDRNQFIASWKEKPIKWHSTITDKEEIITAEPFGYFDWRNQGANYFAWITLITGVLVLLVGLINFFHSLTGSFLTRFHEYGIRRVNGSNEKSLFSLLFIQAILLVSASGLITLICIEILSPFLGFSLFNFSIHIDKEMLMEQTFIYLFYLLFIAAIVCFCITIKIRKTNLQESLFGGSHRYGQHKLRNTLLYIQLFICWIFLSLGTALYLLSWETSKGLFPSLSSTEKESIVSIPLDYTFMTNSDKQMLINRFRQLPGVKDILLADKSYMDGASSTGLFTEKDNPDSFMKVNVININPNFFKFMHIDLLSGKSVSTTNEAIIDKKLAEKLGSEVLGKTYYNYSDAYTVMGVCETFTTYLHAESPGYLFRFYDDSDYIGHCYVKCEPDRVQEVEDGIKEIMKSVLPENLSWQPASLMDNIRNHQAFEFKLRGILLFFAGIVLIISLLGVYSAITLDTEYRRKEMAIRKIHGANTWQIGLLFARLYIWMLITTAVFGFICIAIILRYLRKMYTLFFNDGFLFYGSIFLTVCIIIAFTVFFRIREVARVNPAKIIKTVNS